MLIALGNRSPSNVDGCFRRGARAVKPLPGDLAALAAGGKPALARCLSALETAPDDPALVALLEAAWERPRGTVIGITGPPGVGKSSLCNALVAEFRKQGPERRGDRRRSVVASVGRGAARRPRADRGGPGGRRGLHPLDGRAAAAGRPRRPDLSGRCAAQGSFRPGADRDRRSRPVGNRDRRLRRPGDPLRAAGVRRRAPVHEGRGDGDPGPRAGDQGRPRRPGAPRRRRRARGAGDRPARRPRWLWSPRNPAMASPRLSTASRTGSAGRSSRLPCRRGGAPKAAHWAESRLVELVGKIGLAALATRARRAGCPFQGRR